MTATETTIPAAGTIITVTLNKLALSKDNVRKIGAATALDELAASIAAHGLLNPLTVRSAGRGKYDVIAGQRRLMALNDLAQAGRIEKNAAIPCHLTDGKNNAEISLAENVVRLQMHPADQFTAWNALAAKGTAPAEIAARFGVTELLVRKRLALACVSPKIFAAYRAGTLELEALQAYTVAEDHARQEHVFDTLNQWDRNSGPVIRRKLTETDIPSHDKRVKCIGLDAYEAAGGTVRRDLFDDKGRGYIQDAALLDKLVAAKLDAAAYALTKEGWAWAEVRQNFTYDDQRAFIQASPEAVDLPVELQEEADALEAEREDLSVEYDDEEDEAQASARIQEIDARLAVLEAMENTWTDQVKATAGAVVCLGYEGQIEIDLGLIRPEDQPKPENPKTADDEGEDPADSGPKPLAASLVADLTAQKTAALRIEMAQSPAVALALVVHALASGIFYHTDTRILKASIQQRSLRQFIQEHATNAAMLALDGETDRIKATLPGSQSRFLEWCLSADQPALLDALAVAAAHGLDAVETLHGVNSGIEQAEPVADALELDMVKWYRPTAAGYFSRISKAQIIADLCDFKQCAPAPAWEKMKKAELVALAETMTAKTGWLPARLRTPIPAAPGAMEG